MYFTLPFKFIIFFNSYCYIYMCKHICIYKYKSSSLFDVAFTYII